MNREIKFRAWSKDSEEMISPGDENGDHYPYDFKITNTGLEVYSYWDSNEEGSYDQEDIIPMQYTSLTDKNGIEIYEGDIIAWETGKEPGVQDCKMVMEFHFGQLGTMNTIPAINNTSEVIGNVYSNPELMTPTVAAEGKAEA